MFSNNKSGKSNNSWIIVIIIAAALLLPQSPLYLGTIFSGEKSLNWNGVDWFQRIKG